MILIPIGGLGASQFRTSWFFWKKNLGILEVAQQMVGVNIFWNSGQNEYSGAGIWEWLKNQPNYDDQKVVLGHSLGVDTAIHTCKYLSNVKKLFLFAPVWHDKETPTVPTVVFKPTSSIFPQSNVNGVSAITITGTDHNSVCHVNSTIAAVIEELKS